MTIRPTILIADNQDITRAGLHSYVNVTLKEWDVSDVFNKSDLIKAVENCGEVIVIIDYTLFDFHSIEELLIILKRFPDSIWIMFSSELSIDFIRRAAAEDKISMVLKENSGEEIKSALLAASKGCRFLSTQIAHMLQDTAKNDEINNSNSSAKKLLTPTEIEILKLIAQGLSVKEMANQRFSSTHTIITHKKNIFRKLGINNVYEATRYALRAGLIEIVEYYI